MSRPRERNARGFSLVEVLMAMAITVITVAGTTGLIALAVDRGTNARKLSDAQFVANQLLERLRLEVRYDAEPTVTNCGTGSNHGCSGATPFSAANAWRAERLPYASGDAVPGTGSCNPDGIADGQAYDVGPFRVRHEDQDFQVCYALAVHTAAINGLPANSVDARVKVFWQSPSGYAARWASGVLLNGR